MPQAYASRFTKAWLSDKRITGERLIDWPPKSPDLNPIKNIWSILKRLDYENGHKLHSNKDIWERIKKVSFGITPQQVHTLTSSVDNRLLD